MQFYEDYEFDHTESDSEPGSPGDEIGRGSFGTVHLATQRASESGT